MGMGGRQVPPLGSLGNLWNAAATGSGTNSNPINVYDCPWVTIMGHANGACALTVYYSPDGAAWYASANKFTLTGAGDFTLDFYSAAPWIALQSSANVTATATCLAKD